MVSSDSDEDEMPPPTNQMGGKQTPMTYGCDKRKGHLGNSCMFKACSPAKKEKLEKYVAM